MSISMQFDEHILSEISDHLSDDKEKVQRIVLWIRIFKGIQRRAMMDDNRACDGGDGSRRRRKHEPSPKCRCWGGDDR